MFDEFKKIQQVTNRIDKLLLKGLGLMLVIILVAGLNSTTNAPTILPENKEQKEKPKNITYSNCVTTKQVEYTKPDPVLKTNTKKAAIDLVSDTETAGVTKGEIIALTEPEFVELSKTDNCINPEEIVYSFIYNQTVKIYPKSILRQHQLVHDQVENINLLITYSPFSDSANIYHRDENIFGISGRIYKGSNLIYDLSTESLWLDFNGRAVIGDNQGKQLTKLILRQSTYEKAKQAFPNAKVLNFDNGYGIDYSDNPYAIFEKTSLPFGNIDASAYENSPREKGISFEVNKKNYFFALDQLPKEPFEIKGFHIFINDQLQNYEVGLKDSNGNIQTIPYTYSYFYTFHEINSEEVL
jgi:hypothetical protein